MDDSLGSPRFGHNGSKSLRSLHSRFFFAQQLGVGFGADAQDDVTHQELGGPEEIPVGLADQEPRKRRNVLVIRHFRRNRCAPAPPDRSRSLFYPIYADSEMPRSLPESHRAPVGAPNPLTPGRWLSQ